MGKTGSRLSQRDGSSQIPERRAHSIARGHRGHRALLGFHSSRARQNPSRLGFDEFPGALLGSEHIDHSSQKSRGCGSNKQPRLTDLDLLWFVLNLSFRRMVS